MNDQDFDDEMGQDEDDVQKMGNEKQDDAKVKSVRKNITDFENFLASNDLHDEKKLWDDYKKFSFDKDSIKNLWAESLEKYYGKLERPIRPGEEEKRRGRKNDQEKERACQNIPGWTGESIVDQVRMAAKLFATQLIEEAVEVKESRKSKNPMDEKNNVLTNEHVNVAFDTMMHTDPILAEQQEKPNINI